MISEEEVERNFNRAKKNYFPNGIQNEWYKKTILKRIKPQLHAEEEQDTSNFYTDENVVCLLDFMEEIEYLDIGPIRRQLFNFIKPFPLSQGTSRVLYSPKETVILSRHIYQRQNYKNRFYFPTYETPLYIPPHFKINQPNIELDVYSISNAISEDIRESLCNELDKLADKTKDFPVPNYQNIIDPNMFVNNDLWIATDFLIEDKSLWNIEIEILLQKAANQFLGQSFPPEMIDLIRQFVISEDSEYYIADKIDHSDYYHTSDEEEDYFSSYDNYEELKLEFEEEEENSKTENEEINNENNNNKNRPKKLTAKLMGSVQDLPIKEYGGLHYCIQEVFQASLPILARLRKPALLLPGILQTVIKAQKIYVNGKEEYTGVWHRDGEEEKIVAVVLYYYRVSDQFLGEKDENNENNQQERSEKGGKIEFVDKTPIYQPFWSYGDCDPIPFPTSKAKKKIASLPHCKVEVEQGTMLVFSNYQVVHRVLKMINETNSVLTREFLAFFVVDQTSPLQSSREISTKSIELSNFQKRKQIRTERLIRQLKPSGKFGLSNERLFSTGNGSAALLGWIDQIPELLFHDLMDYAPNLDRKGLFTLGTLNECPPPGRGISWSIEVEPKELLEYEKELEEEEEN